MLRILVPPSGTAATFTLVKGEPLVFSFQDCNSAGDPYSLANRQLYWATYVSSTNTEIEYYKATIGKNLIGDIGLFALPGTHSMALYAKYGSAPINADLFEALDDGNNIILQATLVIQNGPPRIVDDNTAPIGRYIQNVTRKNDPETQDKPKFEVALAAYVPAGATAPTPNPAINLGSLGLSVATATAGTPYSGSITGATSASTLSVTNLPAGLTLNSSARTIGGTPTTAGTVNFTVVETLAGATNSPKINGVTLTIAAAPVTAPTLAALSLSNTTGQVGTAFNASINGATSGSTLSSGNLPAGLTLNSSARTITGTPTATASSFTLIETLAGATGSPKSNTITLTISAAPVAARTTNTLSNSNLLPSEVSGAHDYFTAREARISRLETAFAS